MWWLQVGEGGGVDFLAFEVDISNLGPLGSLEPYEKFVVVGGAAATYIGNIGAAGPYMVGGWWCVNLFKCPD